MRIAGDGSGDGGHGRVLDAGVECIEQYVLQLLLINPEHYKAVRGKKTDLKDGTRIAELPQDGRLEGSYVPPVAIRVLRDLTRYRTKLVQYQSAIACRIQRLLEQGNIKLASVASDVLGVSAMAMLRALAQGETDAARMANMAQKQLRKKIPQLQLALEGVSVATSSLVAQRNDRGF